MIVPVFVDSNIWVYKNSPIQISKAAIAENWIRRLEAEHDIWISYQVVVEFYNIVIRGLVHPHERFNARDDTRDLLKLKLIEHDASLIERAWAIQDRYRFSWWDATIIAAAQQARCKYLLTEDLQHRQDIDGLIVIDPFQTEPTEILG